jgi:hypothetical protein
MGKNEFCGEDKWAQNEQPGFSFWKNHVSSFLCRFHASSGGHTIYYLVETAG